MAEGGGQERRRLLLVTQWFDPEPTFKGLLFARELSARGFDVEVVTGFPNYPGGKVYPGYRIRPLTRERIDDVSVNRLAVYPSHDSSRIGRVVNYLSFCLSVVVYLLLVARRADVTYVYHPPLTVSLAVALVRLVRRGPVVMDVQDLWPDTLAATGMVSNGRMLAAVGALSRWLYRRMTHLVVLSPGFKRRLVERGVAADRVTVIYNWADEVAMAGAAEPPPGLADSDQFRVLFAGNMGPAQGLDTVLDAAALVAARNQQVRFCLLGGGLHTERLRQRCSAEGLSNVVFLPRVPMAEVGGYLAAADCLLVNLTPDPLFEITIPSKTQAYLAAGRPVVMAVAGDAAELVRAADCGRVVQPGDAAALAEAVLDLATLDAAALDEMGQRGRAFYHQRLSVQKGVDAFALLFRELCSPAHRAASS